jgi:hypothetical protein
MENNLQKYLQMKRQVEENQQAKNRAEGALQGVNSQLEDEFGCTDLEEAKNLLKTKQEEEEDIEREFGQAIEQFEKDWENESNSTG